MIAKSCAEKKKKTNLSTKLYSRQRDGLSRDGFVAFCLIYMCVKVAIFDLSKGAKYGSN